MNPVEVVSPRDRWELKEVLYTGNDVRSGSSWSVARGIYEGNDAIAIRWDGETPSDPGFPTSRKGSSVWYMLPYVVGVAVVGLVQALKVARVVR